MNQQMAIKKVFSKFVRENKDVETPCWLGDLDGVVKADKFGNVYVTLFDGEVMTVKNQRVPNESRRPVIIGYAKDNPKLLQVLRSRDVYLDNYRPDLPNHAEANHQWPNVDTLFVRPEQYMVGLAIPFDGLQVKLYGFMYYLDTWKGFSDEVIDFTSSVPSTGAYFILVEVDDTGTINLRSGTPVLSKEVLDYSDIPTIDVGKVPLFAVKLYAGQTEIKKNISSVNTDIIDLRLYHYFTKADGVTIDWGSVTGKPSVFPPDTSISDGLYVRKFISSSDPTVTDDIDSSYLKTDLWLNQSTGIIYLCVDNASGAAVWIAVGSGSGSGGGGDTRFAVDGFLESKTSVGDSIIITKDTTISEWYIFLESTGSSGSTIVDVNVNGSTIFTNPSNRPEVLYSDPNGWAVSGTPDITNFVAGDVITFDIDSAAVDASGLFGAGNISSSGGSGFNLIVGGYDHTGEIVAGTNVSFQDNGGGQVQINVVQPTIDDAPASPDAMDDEFDGTVLDAKWTIGTDVSSPDYEVAVGNGVLNLRYKAAATTTKRVIGVLQPVTGSSWTFRTKLYMDSQFYNYFGAGFWVYNSGNTKGMMLGFMHHTSVFDGGIGLFFVRHTNYVWQSESYKLAWKGGHIYLELEYDGTNLLLRTSYSGKSYEVGMTEVVSSHLAGITDIGLMMQPTTSDAVPTSISAEYFRKVA